MTGIIGWGAFIPRKRIRAADFKAAWGSFGGVRILEKTVPDVDDDSVTMATNAAQAAVRHAGIDAASVRAIALASSSLPYEQKHQAGTVAIALGVPGNSMGLQFAGSSKSGTEALLCALALAEKTGGHAVVAAGDRRGSSMYSPLEHAAGAAGCALVTGAGNVIAEMEGSAHFIDDIPGDRFRPAGQADLEDIEVREYTERLMLGAMTSAASGLLGKLDAEPGDFKHLCVTEPDGRLAAQVAKKLDLPEDRIAAASLARRLGDTGACSVLLGLISALEDSREGDRILAIAYGEGGGAAALAFRVLSRPSPSNLDEQVAGAEYIDFIEYLKLRGRVN
ncbi:MAG: hypothetical protein HPY55_02810 [Firmicutes bacterium]|nr:hypothetical protein [Bacillota bacterium]